eukprot:m.539241 g.539241  ORF g.539241 m.539241 type:complete len:237 (+) comp22088_c0_seq17:494-1204(+)
MCTFCSGCTSTFNSRCPAGRDIAGVAIFHTGLRQRRIYTHERYNHVIPLSDRWRVFFVDERVVPLDHADSNFLGCNEKLFDHVNIDPSHIFKIDPSLPPDECATAYETHLRTVFGENITAANPPKFDLMLLGMGPDGHTASLFPEHPLLEVDDVLVASITNSPKPPPGRITLTLPVINAADRIVFVCTGAGKAPNLAKVLHKEEPLLPAARVSGSNIEWFVDSDAAAEFAAGGNKM